jgi:hypothetical protein
LSSCDLVVILLGPYYGDRIYDSGISPTHEEFNVARTANKKVLAFQKTGIEYDSDQEEFMAQVGCYVTGIYWGHFSSTIDLGPELLRSVGQVRLDPVEVRWLPISTVPYQTIHAEHTASRGQPTYASILELHAIPVDSIPLRPATRHARDVEDLMTRLRATGLASPGAGFEVLTETDSAHVRVLSQPSSDGNTLTGVKSDPYCGVRVARSGHLTAYQVLPTDFIGALTNQDDLTVRIGRLLDLLAPYCPPDGANVAVVACIVDDGRTEVGDPARLGRSSGAMGNGRPDIVPPAKRAVDAQSIRESTHEIVVELAAQLVAELEARQSGRR